MAVVPTRRSLLVGGAGAVAAAGLGLAGWQVAPWELKQRLGLTPEPYVPDAPQGEVRLETVRSTAMQGDVDLFTAVPAGLGDGNGLPVVVVLHGSSATAADLEGFGLGRFVTAAVEQGTPPFVLAGTDDGPSGWVGDGSGPDPRRMLVDELPGWLAERGFDADRRALWGWSRGGYGALALAEADPGWAAAVAAFSPAVSSGDGVLAGASALADVPVGLWCGESDGFAPAVRELAELLPTPPEVLTFAAGGHTRIFWNDHTLDAFDWLGSHL